MGVLVLRRESVQFHSHSSACKSFIIRYYYFFYETDVINICGAPKALSVRVKTNEKEEKRHVNVCFMLMVSRGNWPFHMTLCQTRSRIHVVYNSQSKANQKKGKQAKSPYKSLADATMSEIQFAVDTNDVYAFNVHARCMKNVAIAGTTYCSQFYSIIGIKFTIQSKNNCAKKNLHCVKV